MTRAQDVPGTLGSWIGICVFGTGTGTSIGVAALPALPLPWPWHVRFGSCISVPLLGGSIISYAHSTVLTAREECGGRQRSWFHPWRSELKHGLERHVDGFWVSKGRGQVILSCVTNTPESGIEIDRHDREKGMLGRGWCRQKLRHWKAWDVSRR